MFLKSIIVILLIAILVSLFSGLRFLVKDMGNSNNRVFHSLVVRVTLAVLLIGTQLMDSSRGNLEVMHLGTCATLSIT